MHISSNILEIIQLELDFERNLRKMSMKNSLILVCVVSAALNLFVNAEPVEDDVCNDKDGVELWDFDDIVRLNQLWRSKQSCSPYYQQMVEELQVLVEHSQLCSPEKINAIRVFHRKYISQNKYENYKRPRTTPKVVDVFFKLYSWNLSKVCKQNIVESLKSIHLEEVEEQEKLEAKKLLSRLGVDKISASQQTVNDYDDVSLVWDILGDYLLNNDIREFNAYVVDDPENDNGGKGRAFVKMSNPEPILDFQCRCKQRFKPIYEQTLMSVVHLANLGYSAKSKSLTDTWNSLRDSPEVKSLYGITQLCENILPIRVYKDVSLAEDSISLISIFEANKLSKEQSKSCNLQQVVYDASSNKLDVNLDSVDQDEARKQIEDTNFALDTRRRAAKRFFRLTLGRFRHNLLDKIRG